MEIVQPGGGSGSSILLETNSVPNGSQTILNLVAGSGITLTDNGVGNVTIAGSASTTLSASTVVAVSSSPYAISTTEVILLVDTSSARQLNLPNPSTYRLIQIKDATGSAQTNNITMHRFGAEKIEGIASDKTLSTNWGAWTFVANGTDWFMVD